MVLRMGTSAEAQRLRLHTSTAGCSGLIPGWGTKIPYKTWPATKTKPFFGSNYLHTDTRAHTLHHSLLLSLFKAGDQHGISYICASPELLPTLASMTCECGLLPSLALDEASTLLDRNRNPAAASAVSRPPRSCAVFCQLLTGSTLVHSWQKPRRT